MLRTNLSTRPFYNERIVHLLLGLAALIVVGLTALNVATIVRLSRQNTELAVQAERDEARAAELESQAAQTRAGIDGPELERVVGAAREANALIDQRAFSWTELFGRIEATLPADVMVTSVRPDIREGRIWVSMAVLGRRIADIDAFMERLEQTGAFAEVLSRQEEATDDGMYRAALQGLYRPEGR